MTSSYWQWDDVISSHFHCVLIMKPLYSHYDVIMISLWRHRVLIMTSSCSHYDPIITSLCNHLSDIQYDILLSGFGLGDLTGIDPNPDNSVAVGIVKTKSSHFGCLLRLEPNKQANVSIKLYNEKVCMKTSINWFPILLLQMYRLTIRSNNGQLSESFCNLLEEQF